MRRTAAFTLLELLVVVAIIGVLAALVSYGVSRAMESARATNCAAPSSCSATPSAARRWRRI